MKNSPACRVAHVTVRRVGGPATRWSAAQMAAAGGTARGHQQNFRHTAWSPWLVAGCVPARSGPAGAGRGPYPPHGTPALDHKDGDEAQRHSTRPKPLPLPWTTSPQELPFRTGEPT